MESLSKKYILVDDDGRPILKKGCYGHSYCENCHKFFIKKIPTQIYCSVNCREESYKQFIPTFRSCNQKQVIYNIKYEQATI